MLHPIRADLHIHTCLSPCGDLHMSPRNIVAQACTRGIAMIAICDHNSALNVRAAIAAAGEGRVVVLPGMEVCSLEEIHVLAIFGHPTPALELQSLVYEHLPGTNNPEVFGLQVVANEHDEVIAFENRMLIGATEMPVDRIVNEIHRLDGIAIASHIDRESYSVISQLGFIPESLRFDALELSGHCSQREAGELSARYAGCVFVRNSDAHFMDDVGRNTSEYMLEGPAFSEIAKALRHEDGRTVCGP